MATVSKNDTQIILLKNGATIELVDGATTYDIKNLLDGQGSIDSAQREVIEYTKAGVAQDPLQGNDMYGSCAIAVRATKYESTSFWSIIHTAGSAATVKVFDSLIFRLPDYRGASGGTLLTMTGAFVRKKKRTPGTDHDTIEVEFGFKSGPVETSY